MIILQTQPDSLNNWSYFVDYVSNNISANEIIIVPTVLLVIIYSLKYFLGNKFEKKSFIEFALEFPVDFGFIGITFVLTYFFLEIDKVKFGISMLVISLLIALVTSGLRRVALNEYYKTNSSDLTLGLTSIFNACLSVLYVLFILSCIK